MASRSPQNQEAAHPGGGHSPAHAWISSSVTVASGTRDRPRTPAVVCPCAPAPARGGFPLAPVAGRPPQRHFSPIPKPLSYFRLLSTVGKTWLIAKLRFLTQSRSLCPSGSEWRKGWGPPPHPCTPPCAEDSQTDVSPRGVSHQWLFLLRYFAVLGGDSTPGPAREVP